MEQGDKSALHRIKSDEIWHFYAGSPLTEHLITPDGPYKALRLGTNIAARELFQGEVPAGCWFGAEPSGDGPFCLVGCTVAPGFDFADFEMGKREDLLRDFPAHTEVIQRMTRDKAAPQTATGS